MKIAVFCGSKLPEDISYRNAAIQLGSYLAQNNHTLIYGGAKIGIMGILADTVLNLDGKVIGIMPQILSDKEIIYDGLTETYIVEDMPSRKKIINDMADGFIALPGGCGTMDEIFEVITLNQIGYFDKPVGFVNINGYYDGIKHYLNTAKTIGFSAVNDIDSILFDSDPTKLMKMLQK